MNKLRFRVWNKITREMLEWDDIRDKCDLFNERNYTCMLFTGITDMHGTDIYEGDIVRDTTNNREHEVVSSAGSYVLSGIDPLDLDCLLGNHAHDMYLEIVGTKYTKNEERNLRKIKERLKKGEKTGQLNTKNFKDIIQEPPPN